MIVAVETDDLTERVERMELIARTFAEQQVLGGLAELCEQGGRAEFICSDGHGITFELPAPAPVERN